MSESDHQYFSEIEKEFIRLRGAPLLLSPADWRLARRWRQEGIPLRLVLEAIREVFEKRAERKSEARVNGLRYCRQAVESAWQDLRDLGVAVPGGREEPVASRSEPALQAPLQASTFESRPTPSERVAELASLLPERLDRRKDWLRRLSSLEGAADEVELELESLRDDYERALVLSLDQEEVEEMEEQVRRALSALADWSADADRERELDRARARWARRRLSAPRLTLFR